jgi:hypothetical protein
MCGPEDSVIGSRIEAIIEKFHTAMPTRYGMGRGRVRVNGAVVEVDIETGRALSIERVVRYWEPDTAATSESANEDAAAG